jgi:sulfate-transporting ATPase
VPSYVATRSLSVTFGGVRAVKDVDLGIQPGEVVGLVGPNGAGKSTMVDALSGFATGTAGHIELDAHDITAAPPHWRARRGIARSFQSLELLEDLSVAQNLLVASEVAGKAHGRLPPVAWEVMRRFGLEGALERRPGELSHADRKFVALLRALAGNPGVLLLDEPGAGLSSEATRELAEELRRIAHEHGIPVLVVDHDMTLLVPACDRLVVLVDGAVLATGPPREVVADQRVRDAYLGETPSTLTAAIA